jgi:hypothetical protein
LRTVVRLADALHCLHRWYAALQAIYCTSYAVVLLTRRPKAGSRTLATSWQPAALEAPSDSSRSAASEQDTDFRRNRVLQISQKTPHPSLSVHPSGPLLAHEALVSPPALHPLYGLITTSQTYNTSCSFLGLLTLGFQSGWTLAFPVIRSHSRRKMLYLSRSIIASPEPSPLHRDGFALSVGASYL